MLSQQLIHLSIHRDVRHTLPRHRRMNEEEGCMIPDIWHDLSRFVHFDRMGDCTFSVLWSLPSLLVLESPFPFRIFCSPLIARSLKHSNGTSSSSESFMESTCLHHFLSLLLLNPHSLSSFLPSPPALLPSHTPLGIQEMEILRWGGRDTSLSSLIVPPEKPSPNKRTVLSPPDLIHSPHRIF